MSVDEMADALVDVVLALGYSEWSVIGHSLGGHLALDLAARMPESTRAVTLVSATGPDALEVLRHPFRSFATLPWLAGMVAAMRALSALGAGIRCPVLVLRGERDVFVGSHDAAWFDRHPTVVSHGVISGAGHFAHAEQPGFVLNRVLSAAVLAR